MFFKIKGLKLKKAQIEELERLCYFGSEKMLSKVTHKDIIDYFNWSERGIKSTDLTDGLYALKEAKRLQGVNVHELYEPGILEGTMSFYIILGGRNKFRFWWELHKKPHDIVPRVVVDFLKNELFKGTESGRIESMYQYLIEQNKFKYRLYEFINHLFGKQDETEKLLRQYYKYEIKKS